MVLKLNKVGNHSPTTDGPRMWRAFTRSHKIICLFKQSTYKKMLKSIYTIGTQYVLDQRLMNQDFTAAVHDQVLSLPDELS